MVTLEMCQSAVEVREWMGRGYCPVECSVDGLSLVDGLEMDHHGPRAHLESVAVRALRDWPGARRSDPRFVGVGEADADMTFAVAALAGLLPSQDPRVEALASLVAQVDTDPLSVDVTQHPQGSLLLLWVSLVAGSRETRGATAAVWMWHHLLHQPAQTWAAMEAQALARDVARRAQAAAALASSSARYGRVLVIEDGPGWGFDVWYGRREGGRPEQVEAWRHPVVLWRQASSGQVMVGCPNEEVARALFGPQGLASVFGRLAPAGWGGRVAVGGSPRGLRMSLAQTHQAAQALEGAMSERQEGERL